MKTKDEDSSPRLFAYSLLSISTLLTSSLRSTLGDAGEGRDRSPVFVTMVPSFHVRIHDASGLSFRLWIYCRQGETRFLSSAFGGAGVRTPSGGIPLGRNHCFVFVTTLARLELSMQYHTPYSGLRITALLCSLRWGFDELRRWALVFPFPCCDLHDPNAKFLVSFLLLDTNNHQSWRIARPEQGPVFDTQSVPLARKKGRF